MLMFYIFFPMKVNRGMFFGSEDLFGQYKNEHKLIFSSADECITLFALFNRFLSTNVIFLMENSFVSLSEIQNARGIMDVLAEMLSAIEPANKEVYLKREEY